MKARAMVFLGVLLVPLTAAAAPQVTPRADDVVKALPDLTSPEGFSSLLGWVLAITFLSLVPAMLIMVTCFTRIIVVLGLLRQALSTQNIPPNQVLFALAVFMTLVVMSPVYTKMYTGAVKPYLGGRMGREEALLNAKQSLRDFLSRQIEAAGNTDDVYLFLADDTADKKDLTWGDVPTLSLIPAFVVSELKVAFTMGFRIFLPFVIIDLLVGAVLVSMGMLMLPPVMISLPFKLLLFILADGWSLVVGTLMRSFA